MQATLNVIIRTTGRPTLLRALRSVGAQTVLRSGNALIEVLVVQASGDALALPPDSDWKPQDESASRLSLKLLQGRGPLRRAAAAQCGLEAAANRGQQAWALFLDDDDELLPEHLAKLLAAIDQHPQAVAAHTGVVQVRGDAQHMVEGVRFERAFKPWQLLVANHLPIHAVLFNATRVVAAGVRFDPQFDVFEDWDFWLQVQKVGAMVQVPGVSARYWLAGPVGESSSPASAAEQSQAQVAQHGDEAYWQLWRKWWREAPLAWWADLLRYARTAPDQHQQDAQELALMRERLGQSQAYQHGLEGLRDALQADNQLLRRQAEVAREAERLTHEALAQSNEALAQSEQALAQSAEHQRRTQQDLENTQQLLEHTQLELDQARQTQRRAEQTLVQTRQALALSQQHVTLMLASTSWRLTAPLRALKRTWRRLVRLREAEYRTDIWWRLRHRSFPRPALLATVWPDPYTAWCAQHDGNGAQDHQQALQAIQALQGEPLGSAKRPLMSVVMPTFNPPRDFLDQAIASLQAQWYSDWELCIADDASTAPGVRDHLRHWAQREPRIRLVERLRNGHISAASNSALEAAQGQWVVLMDQDDLLPPQALWRVVQAIAEHPEAGVLYSDEDKVDDKGRRFGPYFKPAFDLDLFRGQNMISHLGVYRRTLVQAVGSFRAGYEGSQDHDLALRCIEQLHPSQVIHIPRVLYHWRVHDQSTASGNDAKPYALDAGLRAVQDHLARTGVQADVESHAEIPHHRVLHRWRAGQGPARPTEAPDHASASRWRALCWGAPVAAQGRDAACPPALMDAAGLSQVPYTEANWLSACMRLKTWAAQSAQDQEDWVLLCAAGTHAAIAWSGDLQAWLAHAAAPGVGAVGPARRDELGRLMDAGWLRTRTGLFTPMARALGRETHGYYGQLSLAHGVSALSASAVVLRLQALDTTAPGLRLKAGWRMVWTPEALGQGAWFGGLPPSEPQSPAQAHLLVSSWAAAVSGTDEQPQTDPRYSPHLCERHADHRMAISEEVWNGRVRAGV
jgi:GT2 family glycosyltransferase